MKQKVSDLEGAELDYWVAKAEGKDNQNGWGNALINDLGRLSIAHRNWNGAKYFEPSKNWLHGGPIIERERIDLSARDNRFAKWAARQPFERKNKKYSTGPTPLIAAMRAYVASKFGESVELMKEREGE